MPRQSPSLFEASEHHIPADVLKERGNILCCRGAEVHLIGVLVHVHDKQRHRGRRSMEMIPKPVVFQLVAMDVVTEYDPTGSATKAQSDPAEFDLPRVVSAKRIRQRASCCSIGLAVAAEVIEVKLV